MTGSTWTRFKHTETAACFEVTHIQLTAAEVAKTIKSSAARVCLSEGEPVLFSMWPPTEKELTVFYVRNTPSTELSRAVRNRVLGPELLDRLGLEQRL